LAAVLAVQAILGTSPQAKTSALVAALLFAVHPSILRLSPPLWTRRVAGCRILAGSMDPAPARSGDRALICFLLALLSKESAAAFLALVLVGDFARGEWKPRLRYARIAGGHLLYLGLLWKVQGARSAKWAFPCSTIHLLLFRRVENSQRASRGVEICWTPHLSGHTFLRLFLQPDSGLFEFGAYAAAAAAVALV